MKVLLLVTLVAAAHALPHNRDRRDAKAEEDTESANDGSDGQKSLPLQQGVHYPAPITTYPLFPQLIPTLNLAQVTKESKQATNNLLQHWPQSGSWPMLNVHPPMPPMAQQSPPQSQQKEESSSEEQVTEETPASEEGTKGGDKKGKKPPTKGKHPTLLLPTPTWGTTLQLIAPQRHVVTYPWYQQQYYQPLIYQQPYYTAATHGAYVYPTSATTSYTYYVNGHQPVVGVVPGAAAEGKQQQPEEGNGADKEYMPDHVMIDKLTGGQNDRMVKGDIKKASQDLDEDEAKAKQMMADGDVMEEGGEGDDEESKK